MPPPELLTTRVAVVEWLVQSVPVMVIVELPAGVAPVVVIVSVDVPAPLIVAGLNPAEVPVGKPLALRATLPLKLFRAPIVTV